MREGPVLATSEMTLNALRTFSLESILLIVTLIAFVLGVAAWTPGFGIFLAVISVLALLRAIGIRIQKKAIGGSMGATDKVLAFISSLGVVMTILMAFVMTLFIVGFTTSVVVAFFNSLELKFISLIVGIFSGFFICYHIARQFWRDSSE